MKKLLLLTLLALPAFGQVTNTVKRFEDYPQTNALGANFLFLTSISNSPSFHGNFGIQAGNLLNALFALPGAPTVGMTAQQVAAEISSSNLVTAAQVGAQVGGSNYATASALNAASNSLQAQIAGSVSGVSSFNTRTGAVSLTSGDITGALGLTPISAAQAASQIASSNLATTAYADASSRNATNALAGGAFAPAFNNAATNLYIATKAGTSTNTLTLQPTVDTINALEIEKLGGGRAMTVDPAGNVNVAGSFQPGSYIGLGNLSRSNVIGPSQIVNDGTILPPGTVSAGLSSTAGAILMTDGSTTRWHGLNLGLGTNLPLTGLNWSQTNTITTNAVALKVPAFTNAGTVFYLILFTNVP